MKNNLSISGPMQFKPVLFKGQLMLISDWNTTKIKPLLQECLLNKNNKKFLFIMTMSAKADEVSKTLSQL